MMWERFNPRARAGRDRLRKEPDGDRKCFNPRARAGRDRRRISCLGVMSCFNPRARAGRDVTPPEKAMPAMIVSIHAPVRGATLHCAFCVFRDLVSIHAPVRGATVYF